MAKMRRSRSRRLILDIGSSAVRLCELTQTKSGYQLTRYMQREVAVEPSADEETKRTARADALSELLKTSKIRTKKTIFGVPGQSVFTRTRALPPVPEHKVTQIVRYEIQQQIPFSLDQIALDYQVLSRTDAGGYEVLMAAIKVDVVEKHLEILKNSKRSVVAVDVCPLAAYNWLKYTGEFGDQGECVALLDMGASTTDIVIERNGFFRFTRSLNIGGNDITSGVAKALNVTFAEAEKLKRERGFAPTGDPQRDGKGGEIIGQSLNRLVTELSRSFAYFRSQPGGGPVSRVVLTGGGACLRNIVPFLQRQLGLEVRIAQPLAGLAIAPGAQEVNESPEQATVVLGLALRTVQTVPIEINLIPPRILEVARRKEQAFYWVLSFVTLALIMASIIPLYAKQDKAVVEEIAKLQRVLQQYDPALGINAAAKSEFESQLDLAKKRVDEVKGKMAILDQLNSARIPWLTYLVALNDARPEGAEILFQSVESTNFFASQRPVNATRAPVSAGPRGGGGIIPTFDDEEDDVTGTRTSSSTAPSGPASAAYYVSDTLASSGFSGLAPSQGAGGVPTGGALTAADPMVMEVAPPQPVNGLTIQGYSKDPETIPIFVERLKQSPLFHPEGVFFSDASANLVRAAELDKPGAARPYGNTMTGGGTIGPDFSAAIAAAGGGFAGGSAGVRSGVGAGSGGAISPYEETYTSFRIDVQFASAATETPAPATTIGGGALKKPAAEAPAPAFGFDSGPIRINQN